MTKEFSQLGLSQQTLDAVDALGYSMPSPVQEQAIPVVLEGHDIIAAAKTGTGKTAAFSLPTMNNLGHARHGQGPLMLVVTPTRELAMQIDEVCSTIGKLTHHNVTSVVGGVGFDPQIKAIKRGCDVLIATPGRLIDLMNRQVVRLNQVETLVLDEADRMLDMGFLPDMRKIVSVTPDKRQTLLFSATIDESIEKNMGSLVNNPRYVEIAHKGETADTVEQYVISVDQRQKPGLLTALLNEKGGTRIIVFARTRHRADNCCRKLRQAGFKAEAIHSDRSQNQRKRALDGFANGKTDILVATDVLARGIDVSEVNYVVNFDLPNVPEDYVHRIGRTGRAGAQGFAVSFVTPETKGDLKNIEKLIGKKIPTMDIEGWDAAANEEALAARATRKSARKDPELAEAAKEYAKKQAKKKRVEAGKADQPQKTRGTAKKQGKKNQKAGNRSATAGAASGGKKNSRPQRNNSGKRNGGDTIAMGESKRRPQGGARAKSGSDFRPGRAQRAARSSRH